MKIALELEFPDEQAASVLKLLQSLPVSATRLLTNATNPLPPTKYSKLTEPEQMQLMHELFGSWQSEGSGDELNRQLREARYFRERDVEL